MFASGAVDGTSKGRIQRGGRVCATRISYREGLSVRKKQVTNIEETDGATTKRHELPFDASGPSVERKTIERGDVMGITSLTSYIGLEFVCAQVTVS